ncbi:hypothetical protein CC1G_14384 [Coprinopsis cinerea okayama7|uniref:Mid2 domain-containing protein n=1 Tax=Coprinopsis cinerea (strain Okayama-7 / 130 / ATCC MYA-4618 / FGSC 9003) TaxID=240176 RepID=D6RM16_COPC7|nr:hypothetical protein CC1G_14384 [Coprinopsis cinerea okayama7\|eukprot:XP_002911387.1 hypothetical protein CC1G_14384 [Coprinopsis cinerea okayama7\
MLLRRTLRSCLLALLLTQVVAASYNYRRQGGGTNDDDDDLPPRPSVPSVPGVPDPTSSSTPTSAPTSTPTSSSASETASSEPETSSTNTPPPETTREPTPSTPAEDDDDEVITTTEEDDFTTITRTNTISGSGSRSAPSETATSKPKEDNDEGEGIGTGSIIGMSVAGGLAVIGIIAFFVWKLTRKKFSTFDDNEPIKWPELNSHGADSHPLPVRDTGRAGFDTGSDNSLSRVNSSNYSTTDFGGHQDPYAVPPLPHLNPNQPYRDDPNAAAGYYDPYRGPVPPTVEHGQDWAGEAIPMTQMQQGQVHAAPPPPAHGGYDAQAPYNVGRQSPGPLQAYDAGRASPAPPNMGYQSYDQYGGDPAVGRQSPGPNAAYAGRMSPGPNAAFGAAGYGQAPPSYGPR